MPGKWFANKGQVMQVGIGSAALILSAKNSFPDLKKSEYFSGGSILFYILVALVITSISKLVTEWKRLSSITTSAPSEVSPEPLTKLEAYAHCIDDPNLRYKSKVRVKLRNDSKHCIDVKPPRWITEPGDVPAQTPSASSLEVE